MTPETDEQFMIRTGARPFGEAQKQQKQLEITISDEHYKSLLNDSAMLKKLTIRLDEVKDDNT